MGVERVLERRRARRDVLVETARRFADELTERVELRAAVVIGSVARGDFNVWSDIDLLVIADALPERSLDRLAAVEPRPPLIQPIPWTPAEWRYELARGNPMAVEATDRGIWLRGSPDELGDELH